MNDTEAGQAKDGRQSAEQPVTGNPLSPEPAWADMISESSTFSFELQRVFGRAVVDPDFRERLFDSPESVLKGIGMPEDERRQVMGVGRGLFDSVVEGLRLELEQALAQLSVQESRIVDLAKDWEAQIMAILPDEDEPLDPSESSEGGLG